MAETRRHNGTRQTPALLVSVRSVAEARAALQGGCDILDVKEPLNGPLGRARQEDIADISAAVRPYGIPVSAAMGEVTEWVAGLAERASGSPSLPGPATALNDLNEKHRPALIKLGLSGLSGDDDWRSLWESVIQAVDARYAGTRTDTGTHPRTDPGRADCVAVIYADWHLARAPSPDEVLEVLEVPGRKRDLENPFGNRFAGVLIDTFSKTGGSLLEYLSVSDLDTIGGAVRESGRFFALAGRLTASLLRDVAEVNPDVIAVRSAACRNQDRTLAVDEQAVRNLRAEIQQIFAMRSEAGHPHAEHPLAGTGASHDES